MPIEAIETKEVALEKSGLKRESYCLALVNALTSNKIIFDKFGRDHIEPDTPNRLKAAEIIAKLLGDLKPENIVDNRKLTQIQQIIYVREDSYSNQISSSRLPATD